MNAWRPCTLAQWLALLVGIATLVACLLLGLSHEPKQALLSYLFAFFFFTGLSIGSLALLMIHALTGGAWGDAIRPPLLAAARLLPLMALAAVPVLAWMHVVYPWTASTPDTQAQAQSWYLAGTFFVVRTVAYFVVWIGWMIAFTRNMDDRVRARRIAAPGLVVFGVTSLLASVDWAASLTPHWHSSIFGMMVGTGWLLGACALAVAVAASPRNAGTAPGPGLLHDLGNMLLMFVLAWSYLAFMEYLTVWIADLPDENAWYIPRTLTSWRYLAWFLIAFNFALPFAALLSRAAKRDRAWLRAIAVVLVAANFADAFWLIVPGHRAGGFALRWTDLCAPVGIGALWWCAWTAQLGGTPRVPHADTASGGLERSHG
jgi:hypothetical protein